jgi:hypothetical protein
MRRTFIAMLAAVPLAAAPAVAQADGWPGFGGPWSGGPTSTAPAPQQQDVAVFGTVVSVNASAGTFVANAMLAPMRDDNGDGDDQGEDQQGGGDGGHGFGGGFGGGDFADTTTTGTTTTPTAPTFTQVTVYTNSSTKFHIGGMDNATIGNLVAGARFFALFAVPASTGTTPTAPTIQTVVTSTNPAIAVGANVPKQLYGAVGTVTAVSTTNNTVTINVIGSLPSGFATGSQTFTVGNDTMIIGGTPSTSSTPAMGGNPFGDMFGGSLSNVSVGDVVAVAERGTAGETLAQVEAAPLSFMVDFPVGTTKGTTTGTTTGTTPATTAAAESRAMAFLGLKRAATKSHKSSKKSHKRSHRSSHKH